MPYGYGLGGGFGFRGASPPWPYVGRGRGGQPRCWHYGAYWGAPYAGAWGPAYYAQPAAYGGYPYAPTMTREQELDFLREEANTVKMQLDDIEARIKDLESDAS